MKRFQFLVVFALLLVATSAYAQRPGVFSTLQTNDTTAVSILVGCAVGVSTGCTGGLKAGPIISTSIVAPAITTASGAMTVTPAAGSNLAIVLSTTGDFVVNTNQLYVDTSAAKVGVNTATPAEALDVVSSSAGTGLRVGTSTNAPMVTLWGSGSGGANERNWGATINTTSTGSLDFRISTTNANAPSVTKLSLDSSGNATVSGTGLFTAGPTTDQSVTVTNTLDGNTERADVQVKNTNGVTTTLYQTANSYTTAGYMCQGCGVLEHSSSNGLSIATVNASAAIRLYSGNAVLAQTIASTGIVTFAAKIITPIYGSSGSGVSVANAGANSCGTTTATIAGNESDGVITVGATSGTQCRVTFSTAAPTARDCVATDSTTTIATRSTVVNTTTEDFFGAFVAGDTVTYHCTVR